MEMRTKPPSIIRTTLHRLFRFDTNKPLGTNFGTVRSTPTGTRHSRGCTVANSTEYIQDGYADGSELTGLLNTITREFHKQRVARLTQAIQAHLRPQA